MKNKVWVLFVIGILVAVLCLTAYALGDFTVENGKENIGISEDIIEQVNLSNTIKRMWERGGYNGTYDFEVVDIKPQKSDEAIILVNVYPNGDKEQIIEFQIQCSKINDIWQ